MRRLARGWRLRGAALACLLLAGCAGLTPEEAQVDPLTVSPPSSPNWALAVPPGVKSVGQPTRAAPVFHAEPEALMAEFDHVAVEEPFVERAGGALETPVWRSYVQRSKVFRFPDYVSVRALDLGDGRASLAIYSRAVYGYGDFGVNAARVDRWLSRLEERLPPEQ